MPPTKLMIVLGERQWTMQALHLACAMARRQDVTLILVKMVPVVHPQMLGTASGNLHFTLQDEQELQEYASTAEDYGVSFELTVCQYASFIHAVVDVAEQLAITAVFAAIPHSHVPFWVPINRWWLRLQLNWHNRHLYTLEPSGGDLEWTPAILYHK